MKEGRFVDLNDFQKSVEFDLCSSGLSDTLLESYHIRSLISSGSRSTIYLLKRKEDESSFVLKAITQNPNPMQDLNAMAPVHCRGFNRIEKSTQTSHFLYYVKPYIQGMTLYDYKLSNGALTQYETLSILYQIVNALVALKKSRPKLKYRKILPEDVIIDSRGRCTIIDPENMEVQEYSQDYTSESDQINGIGNLLLFLLDQSCTQHKQHKEHHKDKPNHYRIDQAVSLFLWACLASGTEQGINTLEDVLDKLLELTKIKIT